MAQKRKRCVDLNVVLDSMCNTKIMEYDDMDDLVSDLDKVTCMGPEDEYILLENSMNYTFDVDSAMRYINDAKRRFTRYLKEVNFYEYGYAHIKDSIENMLNAEHVTSKVILVNMIKEIDEMILNAVDDVSSRNVKRMKAPINT